MYVHTVVIQDGVGLATIAQEAVSTVDKREIYIVLKLLYLLRACILKIFVDVIYS